MWLPNRKFVFRYSITLTAILLKLVAFSGTVALPAVRAAVAGFGQFTIRANTGLGVDAPEQAVIRSLHRRVRLRGDELPLPAQRRTQPGMVDVETFRFAVNHAAPPEAAFRKARLTATRASWTL